MSPLKQAPPTASRLAIGALIAQISRQWRRSVDRQLQPFGLTEATWLPLLHVARSTTPMRQKELAASLFLDGSSVVRLIDELQAAGLVERREADDDRRAKAIVLTPLGRDTVVKVERSVDRTREEAMQALSDDEVDVLAASLRRISASLNTLGKTAATETSAS